MENKDIKKFVNYCKDTLNFKFRAPEGYPSAPICALDAIFSLGIRYKAVENVINKFCKEFNIAWKTSDKKTSDLLKEIEEKKKKLTDKQFAKKYLNLNKTSSTNGILKAEAFVESLKVLKQYNIETCEDIKNKADEKFESAFMSIKGQTYGTSLHYFYMLCGNDDLVKVDRYIKRFSCQALNNNNLKKEEITKLFQDAVVFLKDEYPEMTPRQLDYIVWRYMRSQKNKKENDPKSSKSQKRNKNKLYNKANNTSDSVLPKKNKGDKPIDNPIPVLYKMKAKDGGHYVLEEEKLIIKSISLILGCTIRGSHFCAFWNKDVPNTNIDSISEIQDIIKELSLSSLKWQNKPEYSRKYVIYTSKDSYNKAKKLKDKISELIHNMNK